jgi:cephalosporin-C deacetylase-like acetyl esterase
MLENSGNERRFAVPRPGAWTALAWVACGIAPVSAASGEAMVTLDRADGIYAVGEPARWSVRWEGGAAPAVRYRVSAGQLVETAAGELDLGAGSAVVEHRFSAPGTVLLEIAWTGADGVARRALGGAVAEPGKIGPSAPRPEDFDAFWAEKLRELRAVPADPVLEEAPCGEPGVARWKITMNHVRGAKVRGQVARPVQGEKFPALLIVQWAGVYALKPEWVTKRASEGWLVLDVMPHDLPIDEPEAFYKAQNEGPLRAYWAIGNDDRETSYFLGMYLSGLRGADYLASREDWDGRVLVAAGGSQGGMQALMIAALHPRVTAALAAVPAGCDMLGPVAGRRGGFPQWFDAVEGRDPARVREASRYFDVVNFAPAIRCPVLVSAGLLDEVCPPEGILAAVNGIPAPKELVLLPLGEHMDKNGSHVPYYRRMDDVWLPALRAGAAAPSGAAPAEGPAAFTPANAEWNRPIEPFTIAGNRHYVGAAGVPAFLVTTPEGRLLIDSGFRETAPGCRLAGNAAHPEIIDDFRAGMAKLRSLPCGIFLSIHSWDFGLHEKIAARTASAAGNPFVDPGELARFVDQAELRLGAPIDEQTNAAGVPPAQTRADGTGVSP